LFEGFRWNRRQQLHFVPQVPYCDPETQQAAVQKIEQTSSAPAVIPTHSPKPHLILTQSVPLFDNINLATMNAPEQELQNLIRQLRTQLAAHNYDDCSELLSRCKIALLNLKALIPTPQTPQRHLVLARESLELGSLASIHLKDAESFTRYFQQLQPFYALPEHVLPSAGDNASKITGLYLLLLLSQGDYAGFHTLLETLEMVEEQRNGNGYGGGAKRLEDDQFIQYPVRLEQALMEGSYDRVWGETKGEAVPSEEFRIFSDVSFRLDFGFLCVLFANDHLLGSDRDDSHRDCRLQREIIRLHSYFQRKEPLLPRLRGRSSGICTRQRLDSKRRSHILSTTGARSVGE